MSTTVLVGAGAHGKDIEVIHERCTPHPEQSRLILYDDAEDKGLAIESIAQFPTIIGVNDPTLRFALSKRFPIAADPLVDPDAIIGPNCHLADGVVIAPRTLLHRDVTLGEHTHVNYGSMLTRCKVGNFVTIGPGVTVCGDTVIGNYCLIGAGAVIKNLVNVGTGAIVGAGAVVVADVPAMATVKGVPAK